MAKKAFVPPRIAPLQRVVTVPITDPAEQAALDELCKRRKQKQRGRNTSTNRNGARKGADKGKS